MKETQNPWLRHEEVGEFIQSIEDEPTKAFVSFGITTLLTKRGFSTTPCSPFDLLFFAQALRAMFARRTTIKSIVEGDLEQFAWPD